jgi:hypothetical protein
MTIRGQDFDEAAAYARTTRTLERLCRDYGFEYVLGVFSNGMPEHERMREEEERQRAQERMRRRQARVRLRRQLGGGNGAREPVILMVKRGAKDDGGR